MENRQGQPTTGVDSPRRQTALWIIAILLAVIATTLLTQSRSPMSIQSAFADGQVAGARGIFAFIGPLDKNRTGLWMIDVDAGNAWVYEYMPVTRKLRLAAARSFVYDRYLEDYNCDSPTLDEIRVLLDRQRSVKNRNMGLGAPGDDDVGAALGVHVPIQPIGPDNREQPGGS